MWRLQTEEGDATDIRIFEDEMILVNYSVWEDLDALTAFVYRTAHRDIMVQRRQWFERPTDPYIALWWTPAGIIPDVTEAADRLDALRRDGPTPAAFTFRQSFPAPS